MFIRSFTPHFKASEHEGGSRAVLLSDAAGSSPLEISPYENSGRQSGGKGRSQGERDECHSGGGRLLLFCVGE